MAADGRITTTEMEVLSHLEGLGLGDLTGAVREQLQRAMHEPIDPVQVCGELAPLSREAAATIVAALAEIALADRILSRRESQILFLIARALGLDDASTEHLVRGSLVAHGAEVRTDADDAPPPRQAPPRAPGVRPGEAPAPAPTAVPRALADPPRDATPPPTAPPRSETGPAAPPPSVQPRAVEPATSQTPASASGRPMPARAPAALHVRERPADGLDVDRARDLLGVGPHATREDVDAAYLRLVAFYDPAKVLDLGPEFVVLAVRRLGQATTAYQIAAGAVP